MTIADWIERWSETDRVAFLFEGDEVTYRSLHGRIEAAAQGLVEAGVGYGDRVGFCGLNRVEVFELLFASARIGAIFVPFNNRLTASELAVQAADAVPSIVLVTDGFAEKWAETAPGLPVRDLDARPFVSSGVMLPGFEVSAETTVLMVYTSGTTGQAKGAMLSHDAMAYSVLNGVDQQRLTSEDRVIAPLPTFHVGGINIQTLPTLYVGGSVLLERRFDPERVLDLIETYAVTQTLLVPAMLAAVSGLPAFETTDLSSLQGINSGSSIVPNEVMQPFFDRGVPVGQVYGTTETGPTAIVLGYDEAMEHRGSCGLPATHTELRIVANGEDVIDGTAGEIWLRGPNIFTGYWRNPQATNDAFAPGGWFKTGDVGYRDADGYLIISDRIKDVVISGGENVYPAELEPILATHPAIAEVAVVGQRDQRWGEVPVAVVVLAAGESLDLADLREWCNGRMARFKHPRRLRIVDELPKTALGKVKKHELRR